MMDSAPTRSRTNHAWPNLADKMSDRLMVASQRRLDKVMCTKYQIVELVKVSLRIDLL